MPNREVGTQSQSASLADPICMQPAQGIAPKLSYMTQEYNTVSLLSVNVTWVIGHQQYWYHHLYLNPLNHESYLSSISIKTEFLNAWAYLPGY